MTTYERVEKVIKYLEDHYLDQPSLEELSKVAGLSPYHFQRVFTKWSGISPKEFLKFLTLKHAKKVLAHSRSILSTTFESGLSGSGRLHDLFITLEAVSPGEYKSLGQGLTINYGFHETHFGKCLIGVTKRGICFLGFDSELQELKNKWPNATIFRDQKKTKIVVQKIFSLKSKGKISLLVMGTPFQIKVWEALLKIPEGYLLSYQDIAKISGKPKAARAAGSAIGDNAISYLIPCHRVIRDTGHFSNYRWDPVRKKAILIREAGLTQNEGPGSEHLKED